MQMLTRHVCGLVVAAGCATTPAHPIPLAVIVDGDRSALGTLPTASDGLELRTVARPTPAAVPRDDTTAIVATARTAYASGDFDACRAALASVDVPRLLAAEQRVLVARALALDAACAWGATNKTAAIADAGRLAAFGLDLPDLAVSPDVERVLGEAITGAGNAGRAALAIDGRPGARVAVDGRSAHCTLPCTVELVSGEHVVAVKLEGYAPAWRIARVPDVARVALEQTEATPELAAEQWLVRVGLGMPPADATGAALLGRFAGPRVAYVFGDRELSGALAVDGKLAAHDTQARGHGEALVRELAYDGGVLHRPSIVQRPWFWIAVTGAAIVLAGAIIAATYQPPIHTTAGF
jgi:hypothetical protein